MGDKARIEGLQVLSPADCLSRLTTGRIGRVGFIVEGRPQVLPINYAMVQDSVVFRTSQNSILTHIAGEPVILEVDGFDVERRAGWSVCVHGSGREITGEADPIATARRSCLVSWAPGPRDRWFTIASAELTGRRIPVEAEPDDFGGWVPGVVS